MAARPYAERMEGMLQSVARASAAGGSPLLSGTGSDNTHLLVLISADRGLCGGFNISLMRGLRQHVMKLQGAGKVVKLIIVGRKGVSLVRREFPDLVPSPHLFLVPHVQLPKISLRALRRVNSIPVLCFTTGLFLR